MPCCWELLCHLPNKIKICRRAVKKRAAAQPAAISGLARGDDASPATAARAHCGVVRAAFGRSPCGQWFKVSVTVPAIPFSLPVRALRRERELTSTRALCAMARLRWCREQYQEIQVQLQDSQTQNTVCEENLSKKDMEFNLIKQNMEKQHREHSQTLMRENQRLNSEKDVLEAQIAELRESGGGGGTSESEQAAVAEVERLRAELKAATQKAAEAELQSKRSASDAESWKALAEELKAGVKADGEASGAAATMQLLELEGVLNKTRDDLRAREAELASRTADHEAQAAEWKAKEELLQANISESTVRLQVLEAAGTESNDASRAAAEQAAKEAAEQARAEAADEARAERESLEKDLEDQKTKAAASAARVDELAADVAEKETRIEEIELQIKTLREENEAVKKREQEAKDTAEASAKAASEAADSAKTASDNRVNELEARVKKLQEQIEAQENTAQGESDDERVQALEQQIQGLQGQLEAQQLKTEKEKEGLNSAVKEAETRAANAAAEVEKLQEMLTGANQNASESNDEREDMTDMQARVVELQEQLESKENATKTLQASLDEARDALKKAAQDASGSDALKVELDEARAALKTAKESAESAKKLESSLKAAQGALEEARTNASSQVETLQASLKEAQAALEEARGEAAAESKDNAKAKEKIDALNAKIKELETSVADLETAAAAAADAPDDDDREAALKKIKDLETVVGQLEAEKDTCDMAVAKSAGLEECQVELRTLDEATTTEYGGAATWTEEASGRVNAIVSALGRCRGDKTACQEGSAGAMRELESQLSALKLAKSKSDAGLSKLQTELEALGKAAQNINTQRASLVGDADEQGAQGAADAIEVTLPAVLATLSRTRRDVEQVVAVARARQQEQRNASVLISTLTDQVDAVVGRVQKLSSGGESVSPRVKTARKALLVLAMVVCDLILFQACLPRGSRIVLLLVILLWGWLATLAFSANYMLWGTLSVCNCFLALTYIANPNANDRCLSCRRG